MSRRLNLQTFYLIKLRWRHGSSLRQAFELSLRFSRIGEEKGVGYSSNPTTGVGADMRTGQAWGEVFSTTGVKWLWFPLLHKL